MSLGKVRLVCLLVCAAVGSVSCIGLFDGQERCQLQNAQNRQSLAELGEKARIAELSATCSALRFCFANFHDPSKVGWGYCSRFCADDNPCPSGFSCEVFLRLAPPGQSNPELLQLTGEKICMLREGPL